MRHPMIFCPHSAHPSHDQSLRLQRWVVVFCCLVAFASPSKAVDYSEAKALFSPGEQDYCFDDSAAGGKGPGPKYRARSKDRWVALIQIGRKWFLEEAVVTRSGKVSARRGKPLYFFKRSAFPFKLGEVSRAKLDGGLQDPESNPAKTEQVISFKQRQWTWVEWGGSEGQFYLSDGISRWTTSPTYDGSGPLVKSGDVRFPESYAKADYVRDGYDGGHYVGWAGDINGDGLLDLITDFRDKEVWGSLLWMGTQSLAHKMDFRIVLSSSDGCS